MNRDDARYLIKELEYMGYLSRKVSTLKKEVEQIQRQIDEATEPSSPNGHEYTGAARAMSYAGKESYLNMKISDRDKKQAEYRKWLDRYIDAQMAYYTIMDLTDEKDFVKDYFSGIYTKAEIEQRYNITKAWKRLLSIVMNTL